MNEVKQKRSYEKESYKTKPHTVRFDKEKFEFFMGREKLKTAQQLADYFLNKYWWEHKMPHVTAKEAPPLELKTVTPLSPKEQAAMYNSAHPDQLTTTETMPLGSFEILKNKILKTNTVPDLQIVMKEVKIALLGFKQKQTLEEIAKEHSKQFYTD